MHKSIKVSEFLHRVKEPVELQPEQEYSLVTIKVHHRGVTLRNKTKGNLIGSKMYRISKGQFILSGIDARHGAFGIVPDELEGAIVTNDFWYFEIDETKVKRDFFYWLTNTPIFLNACIKSSQGVTQRVRLQSKLFFDFEFRFPPLEEQESFLKKFQHADKYLSLLRVELNDQEKYVSQLKQAILQEAIAGQLTAEWRTQNPMQQGNPDTDAAALLAKIKAKKQQLIADGKLKKEKPLAEINLSNLTQIPNSWKWTKLGDLAESLKYGTSKKCSYSQDGLPVLRIPNLKDGTIDKSDLKYTELSNSEIQDYALRSDDVLMIRSNGSKSLVGRTAIISDNFEGYAYAGYLVRLRFIQNLLISGFLYLVFESKFLRDQIEIPVRTTTGVKNINSTEILNLIIPLPPLAEQKAIVEKCDRLMNIIDQLSC